MNRIQILLIVMGLFVFQACNDDEPVDQTEYDWEFLLEDSEGIPNHLTISSAYWVFGNEWNLHGDEVWYHLTEAHGHPDWISDIEPTDVKWILDVETYLLDYENHTLYPDIDQRINQLAGIVAGKESRISMFYIADEPYLNGKQITRTMLETAIGKLKEEIPGIPTYITFAHDYFSTEQNSQAGTQPGSNRGIPNNLDYISFNWYSNHTDGSSKRNIEDYVKPTMEKLKKMNSTIHVLLTAEAFDKTLSDDKLPEAIFRYWEYASEELQVVGIDHFSWANNPGFQGITSLPKAQAVVKAFSKEIRLKREDTPTDNKIPVYEYLDSHQSDKNRYEYRYDTWFWKGWTKTPYIPKDVKFYIRPSGEANSENLYLCYVDKTTEVNRGYLFIDHILSTDPLAGGETLAKTSKVLGSIYTAQEAGTVPLYEFISDETPTEHAYSTKNTEYEGKNGYKIANSGQPIGYVYPAY